MIEGNSGSNLVAVIAGAGAILTAIFAYIQNRHAQKAADKKADREEVAKALQEYKDLYDEVKKELDEVRRLNEDLRRNNQHLEDENRKLKAEVSKLKNQNKKLTKRIMVLEGKK